MTNYPIDPVFSDTPTFSQREAYSDKYRTDVLQATDWLGNTFSPGDTVVYCIGAGRGQMMAIGEIQKMRALERRRLASWEWVYNPDGSKRDRINDVYENYWDVEVQVLTTKTSGAWENEKRTRPAWVNPMNITALPVTSESVK